MKIPYASVIIPAYNTSRWIPETLGSVKSQTASPSDFEVIIVNDGSTDDTSEVVSREINGMSNAVFLDRRENKGISVTRNEAIYLSRGRFIMLLDSDDMLEANAIDSRLEFMTSHPDVQYSYSSSREMDTNGNLTGKDQRIYPFSSEQLLHFNFVGHLKCFTRELHDKVSGFDTSFIVGEDYDHVLKADEILSDGQIMAHNAYIYLYRIYGTSMTKEKVSRLRENVIRVVDASLKRRGINGEVFFSHKTDDGFNYYDWRKR